MGLRVIGGRFRGRHLLTQDLPGLRPTTDRVRQSLFNILEARLDLEGLAVLDLCAGSGALGIEALSRGAARCDFVEKSRRTADLVRRNIAALGLEKESRVVADDALRFLKRPENAGSYDLILSDPPYKAPFLNDLLREGVHVLAAGGILLLEHSPEFRAIPHPELEPITERMFGNTAVSIFRRKEKEGTEEAKEDEAA